MSDYKIGDKVRIMRKTDNFNQAGKMDKWIGKIMTLRYLGGYNNWNMEEDRTENSGTGWYWSEDCFEKVESTPDFSGEIKDLTDRIQALEADVKTLKESADRSEGDKEEKNDPEPYNDEIVCVEANTDFTVGKIYLIKNGKITDDDGYEYSPPFTSLENINNLLFSQFAKLIDAD